MLTARRAVSHRFRATRQMLPMADNKRGRPPIDPSGASTRVQVTIGPRQYDAAWRRARDEDVSVSELLRRGLRRVLADPDDDGDH